MRAVLLVICLSVSDMVDVCLFASEIWLMYVCFVCLSASDMVDVCLFCMFVC